MNDIRAEDFSNVMEEAAAIDFLLIGTGAAMQRLPEHVSTLLAGASIRHDGMSTSAAIHTYNIVLAEGRRVAAALVAVENVHA